MKEEERQLTEEFERQKEELREKILIKENQLASTQLELNNLEEYRELQQKQSERISGKQTMTRRTFSIGINTREKSHAASMPSTEASFLQRTHPG